MTRYKLSEVSGGPWVTGWINVLFPYLQQDGWQRNAYVESWREMHEQQFGEGPKATDFPSGLSRVGFTWQYLTESTAMELLGGFVGVSQDRATLGLRPAIGWAVRDVRTTSV